MPLREARAAIEDAIGEGVVTDGDELMRSLRPPLTTSANSFFDGLRSGAYDGNLEASTAVRLASSFRYALGIAPRSEEHTSELQSLMRISYAVFCLKKKIRNKPYKK